QAEDGIRDFHVTGVQTCALPILMVGAVAQRVPLSSALGMSIIGGVGMFSTSIFQPIIGRWIDNSRAAMAATGLTGDELELMAGQATLAKMALFPAILIVLFRSEEHTSELQS